MADNPLNAVNRGVYVSDNLPFLKSLNDGCIDLVCIDPPFAKNETFGRKNAKSPDPLKPSLSDEERNTEWALLRRWGIRNERDAENAGIDWPETRYKDIWSWEKDIHEDWVKDIEDDHPGVHKLIDATRDIHGDGTAAYLCYMAVRLFEIRRVLKDTGSLYLHCDHTANAYLRQLMDAVFGKEGFRNEIAWQRYGSHNDATTKWGCVHDTIYFYAKTEKSVWTGEASEPYSEEYLNSAYRLHDSAGMFTTAPLHARGLSGGGYEFEWRGISDTWRFNESRLEEMDTSGLIYWPPKGKIPRRKVYLDTSKGVPPRDIITDIKPAPRSEKTGYPTQKPVALAERIIKASCPEGGVVLDCFAGCAYVAVAAERLNRNWVACDMNPRAWTVFKRQFSKPKLVSLTCAEPTHALQPVLVGNVVTVHGPGELPTPTAPITEETIPTLRLREKPLQFKTPASIIPEPEMLEILLRLSNHQAWCCGFANRMPDGAIIQTTRNFHLDHLNPVSKAGTSHQITNRAPLCPYHNIMKSNHRLHLAEYREKIVEDGEMMVDDPSELIDLDFAFQRTLDIYSSRQVQKTLAI